MDDLLKNIWTVGHSTKTWDEFLKMLQAYDIEILVDIRAFPGSKRYPHFNKENLLVALKGAGIQYLHLLELGGRRKPKPDSSNTIWRNASFRGYADYMETEGFKNAIEKLESLAAQKRLAYMCSEATWWRCHRALVSDYLKSRSWNVLHIMDEYTTKEHPYTPPAKESQGKLFY